MPRGPSRPRTPRLTASTLFQESDPAALRAFGESPRLIRASAGRGIVEIAIRKDKVFPSAVRTVRFRRSTCSTAFPVRTVAPSGRARAAGSAPIPPAEGYRKTALYPIPSRVSPRAPASSSPNRGTGTDQPVQPYPMRESGIRHIFRL